VENAFLTQIEQLGSW